MTEQEEADLQAMGRDLAGAMQSAWEPACIARAFAWRAPGGLRFTMQSWIDLEHARSPLLQGELPGTIDALEAALRAFGWRAEIEVSPEEAIDLGERMIEMIAQGFAMRLPMQQTGAAAGSTSMEGFGTWLPLWACLVVQAKIGPDAALAMDVGQAYALVAGMRRNQGWEVAGTPYALRDIAAAE